MFSYFDQNELSDKTNTKSGRKKNISKEGRKAEEVMIFRFRNFCGDKWQIPKLPI